MTFNKQGDETQRAARGNGHADESLSAGIDIRVEVFVGDTVFTLADLNRLKGGDVIPLSTTLADPVELRVNGVRIAYGELVSAGDQFAVRIVEIA